MNNLGNIAASILSAATSDGGDARRKADFEAVAKAVRGIEIPDLQQLASLKTLLEAFSKEGGLPATVQGVMGALLQSLKPLDADSQESGNQVWDALKPLIDDKAKLAAMTALFGQYGGKLLDIFKAVFLRA
ncbi:MAG: hypothetical protein IKN96_01230 [Oscillibacter sp.]|nr:hypothetical protein [Oscillibacter sp.]